MLGKCILNILSTPMEAAWELSYFFWTKINPILFVRIIIEKAIAVHAGSIHTLQHNLGPKLFKPFQFPLPLIVAGSAVAAVGVIATSGRSRGR
jgi:hypothetical protein